MTTKLAGLRAEAESEAARLAGARLLVHDGDGDALAQLDAEGPWILVARRTALRRRLEGRVLLIWRVAYEDGSGRLAESRLIAVTARPAARPAPRTRAWRRSCLPAIDIDLRGRIDAEVGDWIAAAVGSARSFLAARIGREQATAARTRDAHPPADAFQPGLFDRRAARRHRDASIAVDDARRAAANRLASLERSATLVLRPARLLLVVVP